MHSMDEFCGAQELAFCGVVSVCNLLAIKLTLNSIRCYGVQDYQYEPTKCLLDVVILPPKISIFG